MTPKRLKAIERKHEFATPLERFNSLLPRDARRYAVEYNDANKTIVYLGSCKGERWIRQQ